MSKILPKTYMRGNKCGKVEGTTSTKVHMVGDNAQGKFLSIVGQDPSDSKSNQLHVDIFRGCFIHLRYIPYIPLK